MDPIGGAPSGAESTLMTRQSGAGPLRVVFDQSLIIGLPELDRQHHALVEELNRLIVDRKPTSSSEVLVDVLSRLGRQLDEHFRYEEGLFGSLGMHREERDAHAAAHQEILSQYVDLNLSLMRSAHDQPRAEMLSMVRQWVVGHIVAHDLRMRELLVA